LPDIIFFHAADIDISHFRLRHFSAFAPLMFQIIDAADSFRCFFLSHFAISPVSFSLYAAPFRRAPFSPYLLFISCRSFSFLMPIFAIFFFAFRFYRFDDFSVSIRLITPLPMPFDDAFFDIFIIDISRHYLFSFLMPPLLFRQLRYDATLQLSLRHFRHIAAFHY
jgi:hypothetical protein